MTTPRKPPLVDDPDAFPASEEEVRAAEALRAALEDPALANDDAEFARALALAHAPRDLAPDEHRAILDRALLETAPAPGPAIAPRKAGKARGVVVRIAFGTAATALSLAAAFALLVRSQEPVAARAPSAAAPAPSMASAPAREMTAMARPRSTQPLFLEPFAAHGGTSARIDRIAMARASDLRDNRFARWGVR